MVRSGAADAKATLILHWVMATCQSQNIIHSHNVDPIAAEMSKVSLSGEGVVVLCPFPPEAHAQRCQHDEQYPAQDVHQRHFENEEMHLWNGHYLARCRCRNMRHEYMPATRQASGCNVWVS